MQFTKIHKTAIRCPRPCRLRVDRSYHLLPSINKTPHVDNTSTLSHSVGFPARKPICRRTTSAIHRMNLNFFMDLDHASVPVHVDSYSRSMCCDSGFESAPAGPLWLTRRGSGVRDDPFIRGGGRGGEMLVTTPNGHNQSIYLSEDEEEEEEDRRESWKVLDLYGGGVRWTQRCHPAARGVNTTEVVRSQVSWGETTVSPFNKVEQHVAGSLRVEERSRGAGSTRTLTGWILVCVVSDCMNLKVCMGVCTCLLWLYGVNILFTPSSSLPAVRPRSSSSSPVTEVSRRRWWRLSSSRWLRRREAPSRCSGWPGCKPPVREREARGNNKSFVFWEKRSFHNIIQEGFIEVKPTFCSCVLFSGTYFINSATFLFLRTKCWMLL